jgi:hypothetical protein
MRISRNLLGLIAVALGLCAGALILRDELGGGHRSSARRRLEKAAREFSKSERRIRRRVRGPSQPLSLLEDDNAVARLIRRIRR